MEFNLPERETRASKLKDIKGNLMKKPEIADRYRSEPLPKEKIATTSSNLPPKHQPQRILKQNVSKQISKKESVPKEKEKAKHTTTTGATGSKVSTKKKPTRKASSKATKKQNDDKQDSLKDIIEMTKNLLNIGNEATGNNEMNQMARNKVAEMQRNVESKNDKSLIFADLDLEYQNNLIDMQKRNDEVNNENIQDSGSLPLIETFTKKHSKTITKSSKVSSRKESALNTKKVPKKVHKKKKRSTKVDEFDLRGMNLMQLNTSHPSLLTHPSFLSHSHPQLPMPLRPDSLQPVAPPKKKHRKIHKPKVTGGEASPKPIPANSTLAASTSKNKRKVKTKSKKQLTVKKSPERKKTKMWKPSTKIPI